MKIRSSLLVMLPANFVLSGALLLAQDAVPQQSAQAPASTSPASQAPASTPPDASTPAPAATAPDAATPAMPPETAAPATGTPAVTATPAAGPAAPKVPQKSAKEIKEEKKIYTGPTEIIVLEPTPMIDDEGRQRLDPDGKPMFNPPQKQIRDKKGHPVFENGKPVFATEKEPGYDEHGNKIHVSKEKPPKAVPVSISRGTLTMDGMVGRASLNYEIADLKYIYLYAPGLGTAVVSNNPFPGATQQKDAFNDKTLTVNIGDHKIELDSDKRLLGKAPQAAYVLIDRDFTLPVQAPVMGYGDTRKAPYQWPGAKENKAISGIVEPPPTPKNLLPAMALAPCPKGQMRMPGPPVLPGQYNPPQPCVSTAQGEANAASIAAATARRNAAAAAAAKAATAAATPAPTAPAVVVAPTSAAPPPTPAPQ